MLYPHPPYCSVEPLPDVELGRRVVASGTWNSDMKGFPADPWNSFESKRGNGKSSTNGALSIVMLDYQSVPPPKKNTMDCQCTGEVDERCAALPSVPNHLVPPSHQSSGCSSRDPTELPQCQGHSVDPNGWVQGFIRFDNFWNSIFRKSIICW